MGHVTEHFDAFPFTEPARTMVRDEAMMLTPAADPPKGPGWDRIPPLDVVRFDQAFDERPFSPPANLWDGDHARIEWQQMNFRQPMYHRNLDVDEMSFQIAGPRTLFTELGTVEIRPGDFTRIPVGVAHDNWGRRASHILWYFPTPVADVAPITATGQVLIPPFEGWEAAEVNEVHTDCLGGRHCDRAVQRSDERLILEQAERESERLQVMRPQPAPNSTQWVFSDPDHLVGITSVEDADGRTYARHRNADEIQYQVSGTRLLITPNGVVEMSPGTFVHVPVGVAWASIVAGPSQHLTTVSRLKLNLAYTDGTTSEKWEQGDIEAYRTKIAGGQSDAVTTEATATVLADA